MPGFDRDDIWVMVEDEFYAIAQKYTQHLHYAEYHRRRKEVKERLSTLVGEIERPTDERTPLPKDVERRRESQALRERQKAGLAQFAGGTPNKVDDDGDELWAGTHLHDFMASPRKLRSLVGLQSRKSSTRAAAGFGQVPVATRGRINSTGSFTSAKRGPDIETIEIDEETASDSDDDLDLEAQSVMAPPPNRAQSAMQYENTPRAHSQSYLRNKNKPTSDEETKPFIARPSPTPGFQTKMQSLFDDLDDLPEPSEIHNHTTFNVDKASLKQQPDTGERKKSDPKNHRHNEVPTFLV